MILYLDTSALVKCYVAEIASDEVLAQMARADVVASHMIAFVEACAAFSRLAREEVISDEKYSAVQAEFRRDWDNYLQISAYQSLLNRAAELAEVFSLRAYDSVHLAAADWLQRYSDHAVQFACFDRKLNRAAGVLGMTLMVVENR